MVEKYQMLAQNAIEADTFFFWLSELPFVGWYQTLHSIHPTIVVSVMLILEARL